MRSTSFVLSALALAVLSSAAAAAPAQYVISISVDGMGSTYFSALTATNSLPNMQTMIAQGATTVNARTDAGVAVTLPSHTGMVTGRPMNDYTGIAGHTWTLNDYPDGSYTTLAMKRGLSTTPAASAYVASVFDVAHDNGLKTGMWATKSKFALFTTSYNTTNGAANANGKNKLDTGYVVNGASAATMASAFITSMNASPTNFSFLHFQDPDAAGHGSSWGSAVYNTAVMNVDAQIGNIMTMVNNSVTLKGKTTIIVTADHGGTGTGHGAYDANGLLATAADYTIPFLVWGAGVTQGDIYAMNAGTLQSPQTTGGEGGMPQYTGTQPIRNGDLGNLSLKMLGLGAIPGSTIGASQAIVVPEPTALAVMGLAFLGLARRRRA